ncbi:hypothetical protein IJQ51_02320 [Candidatus Saccharibacteria bacterium]|nr:hypothetical protein [Candidatus Saccharibacteria bacterium]
MADQETEARWAKLRRIEAEKTKAARDLEERGENKANLAYLPITKPRGFSRDPNAIMQSAERMANISVIFCLLGVVFGVFENIFAMVMSANPYSSMGGGAIAIIFSAVNALGIGVAAITSVVALICTVVFARRTKRKVKPIIITASTSLILIVFYYLVQNLVARI